MQLEKNPKLKLFLVVSCYCYPPKFNSSPQKSSPAPIRKACLPTTIFQGRTVKLRLCMFVVASSSSFCRCSHCCLWLPLPKTSPRESAVKLQTPTRCVRILSANCSLVWWLAEMCRKCRKSIINTPIYPYLIPYTMGIGIYLHGMVDFLWIINVVTSR